MSEPSSRATSKRLTRAASSTDDSQALEEGQEGRGSAGGSRLSRSSSVESRGSSTVSARSREIEVRTTKTITGDSTAGRLQQQLQAPQRSSPMKPRVASSRGGSSSSSESESSLKLKGRKVSSRAPRLSVVTGSPSTPASTATPNLIDTPHRSHSGLIFSTNATPQHSHSDKLPHSGRSSSVGLASTRESFVNTQGQYASEKESTRTLDTGGITAGVGVTGQDEAAAEQEFVREQSFWFHEGKLIALDRCLWCSHNFSAKEDGVKERLIHMSSVHGSHDGIPTAYGVILSTHQIRVPAALFGAPGTSI